MTLIVDIAIIFAVAVATIVLSHRLRLPPIAGLLIAGVVAGPNGLRLVGATEEVEVLAEIGVVLLLFVIGMEFSLRGVLELRRPFLIGGTIQLFGTAAVIGIGSRMMGYSSGQAAFLGFVVALSSTAIVLTVLRERAELDSPHGRMVVGTLIYQDIAVVPLMLAVPLLAGGHTGEVGWGQALAMTGRIAAVGVLAYASYKWVVPWALYQIAKTRSREAFLLGVLVICIAIAGFTSSIGLSLALGAFLAGLIISESEYSHQAVGVIMPFRDAFTSLFFVSIGMLLDLSFVMENLGSIALLALGLLAVKPLVAGGAALALGSPLRSAALAGVALSQIGEFSLVLAEVGVHEGLLTNDTFQLILAVAVASMVLAPLAIAAGPRIADAVLRLPFPERLRNGVGAARYVSAHPYENHMVIVGFGVTGRNVAKAAERSELPYAALEISPESVREGRSAGCHVHYGDATQEAVLRHVNVERAKAVVVVIDDPAAARRVVELSRRLAPDSFIVVRSRYLKEVEPLHSLGADEVIADELEVSVEVFARVLGRFLVPREDIVSAIDEMRAGWREMARSLGSTGVAGHQIRVELPDLRTRTFRLSPHSPLAGRTIAASGLRAEQGVTVLAIQRGGVTLPNPVGATELLVGDVLFVIGPQDWEPTGVA